DFHVTGVQTCALPILQPCPEGSSRIRWKISRWQAAREADCGSQDLQRSGDDQWKSHCHRDVCWLYGEFWRRGFKPWSAMGGFARSEERRVGKECRWEG